MNKTATIKKATKLIADEIEGIRMMHVTLHVNAASWSDDSIDKQLRRIKRAKEFHYNQTTAFAFLFDASFEELERAALDSMGLEHIESAEYLWEHSIY